MSGKSKVPRRIKLSKDVSHDSLLSVEGFHHSKRKSNSSLRFEVNESTGLIGSNATATTPDIDADEYENDPSHGPYDHYNSNYSTYGSSYGSIHVPNLGNINNGQQLRDFSSEIKGFYDDFTTIDWIHDTLMESERRMQLKQIRGLKGKFKRIADGLQGWLLIACASIAFSGIAYSLDVVESVLSGLKRGYCSKGWYLGETRCDKSDWVEWSEHFDDLTKTKGQLIYVTLSVVFALISCFLTLQTKSENPLVEEHKHEPQQKEKPKRDDAIFTASGSGVPEVKTILSGVIIRRFLGLKTLIYKSTGLLFSISAGLNVGKEGPFVHLSTCVGNIMCRYFKKFNNNAIKRRQVLSAAASCGFALAFGSPLGGVLFSLEEVSYYFLPHQLFRIFFCAMMSSLSLKFLDPYGTGKIVPFEVRYPQTASSFDWKLAETLNFIVIGIVGGLHGAIFCKFALVWGKVRKRIGRVTEVLLIAMITGLVSCGNKYARMGTSELLFQLAAPCDASVEGNNLCDISTEKRSKLISGLLAALAIKLVLTPLSFGLTLPAGIYVPTMVLGALFGRIYGVLIGDPLAGVYAMAGAGAFMAGVTRMNITLAVVLFEITGSMPHILLFSMTILVANWVANAIEPFSLYSLLIRAHKYPFLENATVAFSSHDLLAEIYSPINTQEAAINIGSAGSLVSKPAVKRIVSQYMFDACVPITKENICIGTIGVAELEYALDEAEKLYPGIEECVFKVWQDVPANNSSNNSNTAILDITPLVDKAPVTLDIDSPLSLVQMFFIKMGARQICVSEGGRFVGVLHKKRFIEKCSGLLKRS